MVFINFKHPEMVNILLCYKNFYFMIVKRQNKCWRDNCQPKFLYSSTKHFIPNYKIFSLCKNNSFPVNHMYTGSHNGRTAVCNRCIFKSLMWQYHINGLYICHVSCVLHVPFQLIGLIEMRWNNNF